MGLDDAQVGRSRKFEAAAERVAVQRRRSRAAAGGRGDRRRDGPRRIQRRHMSSGWRADQSPMSAPTQNAVRLGRQEHDRAQRPSASMASHGLFERREHGRRQRVELLGPVQRERGDGALDGARRTSRTSSCRLRAWPSAHSGASDGEAERLGRKSGASISRGSPRDDQRESALRRMSAAKIDARARSRSPSMPSRVQLHDAALGHVGDVLSLLDRAPAARRRHARPPGRAS